MLNVAVIGSGPAGLYAAEALVKQAAALPSPVPVRVDVIDRLPTPMAWSATAWRLTISR